MQFPFITHGMVLYKRQYTDKTLTLRKCMCMRASEASELRQFRYFYILKLLFLSIFCRYTALSVQNYMLVGLHVPTNLSMYRQISKCTDKSPKRHYWGGGGAIAPLPPPPPSGYANDCNALYQWFSNYGPRAGSLSIRPARFCCLFLLLIICM